MRRISASSAAGRALAAFRSSCGPIVRGSRKDQSGLTDLSRWQAICSEAALVAPGGRLDSLLLEQLGELRVEIRRGPAPHFHARRREQVVPFTKRAPLAGERAVEPGVPRGLD